MSDTKKQFKRFGIFQYEKEQAYLNKMHKEGWAIKKVHYTGRYDFEKCMPEDMVYQLDYNQEGLKHKEEYVQMFRDCGWEYLFDVGGYSYFRKPAAKMDGEEEIFCDDESRFDMMKRVFKGRALPLVFIFFGIIIPQMLTNAFGYGGHSVVQEVLAKIFFVLFVVYNGIFLAYGTQMYEYSKKVYRGEKGMKRKYGVLFVTVSLLFCFVVCSFIKIEHNNHTSVYSATVSGDTYTVDAERLNGEVSESFKLQKGDVIEVISKSDKGTFRMRIGQKDKEPIYTSRGDWNQFSVNVNENGCYRIAVSGRHAAGLVQFHINRTENKN